MVSLGLWSDIADGTLCEHALYHVDRNLQEATVREMIRVTKPGKPEIGGFGMTGEFDEGLVPIRSEW